MKKALIFGMGGFVGKYMADELMQSGYEVYACSRFDKHDNVYDGWYNCDLNNSEQVKNVIAEVGPTHIINLAGQSNVGISWRIPKLTIETNVCGAINIIEAVHECDLDSSILMIGSSEEYDASDKALSENSKINASNPYGISKMMLGLFCEIYRKRYGLKLHYVRTFNHTGIGQNDNFVIPSWCKQVASITKSGKPGCMYVGNLDIVRDFSNVKDIVRAYRMIIESKDCSITYNVGSGNQVSLKEILNHVVSLSDQQISVQIDSKLLRPIENPYICCDSSLIRDRLGWKPQYNIFETVEEIYQYYMNKH
ncbi:GDP-mannose 4,6-dehydratase [Butyrivibrio sp. INlla14]|uniref:GDP-mannose 4,6-dehydratase n=1 Tax=Butyrivibrio sp. INlla14 TaxID=1520808 RepID=UPI0008761260|nr:GDP-mannose 4,6-dehydratase [Butyrivibrio sp. INlla14]SCY73132.1 GDPmannose 4,6-dehydratase [Butyrivibrio sp. INlla14]